MATVSNEPRARMVQLLRFDAVQRSAHWLNAALFTILVVTAIPLYFGSFFGLVLPRFTVEQIHLWTGIVLPIPLVVSVVGPWGRNMRRDVRRVSYWTREEIAWLRSLGRTPLARDKFNPGQKLNAIFVAASIPVMLVTGVVLKWFQFFPVSWRAGSTFVHDTFSWLIVGVVVGHVVMALTHRGSMRSMVGGRVSEEWAAANATAWLKEERLPAVPTSSLPVRRYEADDD